MNFKRRGAINYKVGYGQHKV